MKPTNIAGRRRRRWSKGPAQRATRDSKARAARRTGKAWPQTPERVRQTATRNKKERFATLLHPISAPIFRTAFLALKREADPGVDGLTWQPTRRPLIAGLRSCARGCMGGHTGAAIAAAAYSEARWSPAPAGIAAFENKIVQWATARS
jgi:RNA-directed DNA polymerase